MEIPFAIAMIVMFLHSCTQEGMILHCVDRWFQNAPLWIRKPLFSCAVCMVPYWGTVFIAIGNHFSVWRVHSFIAWIFILLVAAGINATALKLSKEKPCDCERKKRLNII